jgi:hypothetical protein
MEPKEQFTLIIGNRRLPLDIHSLAVDSQGYYVGTDRREISFRFIYRRIVWSARFHDSVENSDLHMSAELGVVPFTAESAFARNGVRQIVKLANQQNGQAFKIVDSKIQIDADVPIDCPVTAVGLVGGVARFLLKLQPYLETIEMILMLKGKTGETVAAG